MTIAAPVYDSSAGSPTNGFLSSSPSSLGASISQNERITKHKRRYCRNLGCTSIIKSQGLCQRHGAVAKKCKIEGCPKQAQGNFERMCKKHFKSSQSTCYNSDTARNNSFASSFSMVFLSSKVHPVENNISTGNIGSVYDTILPASVGWLSQQTDGCCINDKNPSLVQHLAQGLGLPSGWHRNDERRVRGYDTVPAITTANSTQHPPSEKALFLQDWERDLVWTEILILSGQTKDVFQQLAHAWGRPDGFHLLLVDFVIDHNHDSNNNKRTNTENNCHHSNSYNDAVSPTATAESNQTEWVDNNANEHKSAHNSIHSAMEDNEFNFDNLEEDIKYLSSADDTSDDIHNDETGFCQPC